MRLSDFSQGRDNNFNLVRIVAAYAVLFTHSFALTAGSSDAEPFLKTLGMTTGTVSVDVFFATSGFLVTASLLTRNSAVEFVWARVLRIFPALLAMLVVTVFGLGLYFTRLSWSAYLTDPVTYRYFFRCLSLLGGVDYELPGVFEDNPFQRVVNGSLWTMPFELRMYVTLAVLWLVFGLVPQARLKLLKMSVVLIAILAGVFFVGHRFRVISFEVQSARFFFMFFSGAALYFYREKAVLSRPVFYAALAAFCLSTFNSWAFFLAYTATILYLLFYVAYVPAGFVRNYNRLGDYSYGVYIYAFPVQQSVAALAPGIGALSMIAASSLITLLLSVVSWHCLEKKALRLKGHFVSHTYRLLSNTSPRSN